MKTRIGTFLLVFLGLTAPLYYAAIKIAENGKFFDFSLVWLFLGAGAWAVLLLRPSRFIKRKSIIFIEACLASFVSLCVLILVYICLPLPAAEKAEAGSTRKAEYLLVLGGGLQKNGEMSRTLLTRMKGAVQYLAENPEVTVIVSGGQGDDTPFPEADAMARYLTENSSIHGTVILKESASRDTIQNMKNSLALIRGQNAISPAAGGARDRTVCVLTSDFHLRRALLLARLAGFARVTGEGVPCPALFVPENYVREIGAYWKLGIRRMLTGPIFLASDSLSES